MDQPIQVVAKIGVVLGTSFPVAPGGPPVEDALSVIVEDPYFDAVELSAFSDPAAPARVRNLCELGHLTMAYAVGPTVFGRALSLHARDTDVRLAAIEALQGCIDDAIALRAERVTLVSGPQAAPEDHSAEVDLLVDSLLRLCEYSLNRGGPPVDLETFDCEIERKRLLGPTALAVEVAGRVRRRFPSFGLLIDMSHIPLLGESIPQALELAHEVLTHVHLGNCVLRDRQHPDYGDSHPRFGLPGSENGVEQLRAALQTLLDLGFLNSRDRPILSFEVRPRPEESPRAVLAGNKRALEAAWWGCEAPRQGSVRHHEGAPR
ncbi:MAG TPA: TIM barrel protein [Anaerolineales bacterium]|nr:TIM barrel protein [Anaerolineales bacterium]